MKKTCPALFCIEYMCGDTMATIKARYELPSDTSIARSVKRAGLSRPRGARKGSHHKGYKPENEYRRKAGWTRLAYYKEKGTTVDWSVTRERAIDRFGLMCNLCGKLCDETDKSWGNFGANYPTLDHIQPLSKGGSHTWDNVQILCGKCNCHVKKAMEVQKCN